jgi:hypothetical protein
MPVVLWWNYLMVCCFVCCISFTYTLNVSTSKPALRFTKKLFEIYEAVRC